MPRSCCSGSSRSAMGQRFLERPGPGRAAALGLSVGVAQLFKYNGWIAGVLVALGAVAWTVLRRDERSVQEADRILGMGPRRGDGRGRRLLAVVPVRRVAWWLRRAPGPSPRLPGRPLVVAGLRDVPARPGPGAVRRRRVAGVRRFRGCLAMLTAIGAPESRFPPGARMLVESLGFAALCAYPHGGWFGAVFWIFIYAFLGTRIASRASCLLLVGLVGAGGADTVLSSVRATLVARPGPRLAPAGGRVRDHPRAPRAEDRRVRASRGRRARDRWSGSWRDAGSSRSCWPSPCRRGPTRGASRRCSSPATRSAAHAGRSPAKSPMM